MSRPRTHFDPFWRTTALFALATAVFLIWMVFRIGGSTTTDHVDVVGELVAALVASGACSVTAYRATEGRLGWLLLGLSSLAWAVGEAFWCYYDLVDHIQDPFPSLADVGFLAAAPLMIAGLLLFPHSPSRTAARLQGLLDGIIIAVSILFASWVTVLGPLYREHQGGAFKQALSLAYPMSDVTMVSLVVILIARTGHRRRVGLSLVMIGVVAFALADSSFAYLTEVDNYGIGNWLDSGWVAGYLLIGLGALWTLWAPAAPVTADVEESVTSLIAPYRRTRGSGGRGRGPTPRPSHRAGGLAHGAGPHPPHPGTRVAAVAEPGRRRAALLADGRGGGGSGAVAWSGLRRRPRGPVNDGGIDPLRPGGQRSSGAAGPGPDRHPAVGVHRQPHRNTAPRCQSEDQADLGLDRAVHHPSDHRLRPLRPVPLGHHRPQLRTPSATRREERLPRCGPAAGSGPAR